MNKNFKKVLTILLILFIVIQVFRPVKNTSEKSDTNGISTKYDVPPEVNNILKASCYDCHSNNTVYPWYAEVQPVAWWLNDHIKSGKRGLNFSEFTTYPIRRQYGKLADINDMVKKDEMPLASYLLIHRYARLNSEQKLLIANWVTGLRSTIQANYPADSLVKKRN